MQKLFSLLAIFAFAAALHAGGIAADTQESAASAGAANLRGKEALETHIRAMMIQDPAKRLPLLLKALELAPDARLPLQTLSQFCRTQEPPLNIQAAAGLMTIAEKHPENLLLNMEAVQLAILSPDLADRAVKAAGIAIKHSKTPRPAFLMLTGVHLQDLVKQKNFDAAYGLLEETMADSESTEPVLLHWLGNVCRTAARNAGTDRRWLGLRQSERAMWQERQAEAVEMARKKDAGLTDFPALQRQTNFYIQMRCPEDALRLADEGIRKFTGNTDAAFLKLTVLLRIRRHQEALALARELIKVSPESPGCLRLLAESALRCGEYDTALSAGRKLLKDEILRDEAHYYIVLALIFKNQPEEARKAIASIKDQAFRQSLENVLRQRTGDWASLLAQARKMQADPDGGNSDTVYLTLLVIAEQTRDVKLLEECWQNMEKLNCLQDAENANNLGYVATVLNHRLEDAGKLIRFALETRPDCGAYMDSMAWHCYKTGNYEKAWEYIQDAMEAMADESSLGVVHDHAGDIARKLGRKQEALHYYRQALGDYLATDLDIQAVQKKIRQLTAEEK